MFPGIIFAAAGLLSAALPYRSVQFCYDKYAGPELKYMPRLLAGCPLLSLFKLPATPFGWPGHGRDRNILCAISGFSSVFVAVMLASNIFLTRPWTNEAQRG